MGETTYFRGAIRIVPRIPETLANRLDVFMEMRHMRRDTSVLDELYPSMKDRRTHSLFDDGDFGVEGAFYLPDLTREYNFELKLQDSSTEGLQDTWDMNQPPAPLPSLYCDLVVVHDENANCSYIGWSGAEKAYCIADWINLFAEQLTTRGYHLDGKMFADVEEGMEYYSITVRDDQVAVEEFVPETTYDQEFCYLNFCE